MHRPEFELISPTARELLDSLPTSSSEVGQVRFAHPTVHIEETAHSRAPRFNPVKVKSIVRLDPRRAGLMVTWKQKDGRHKVRWIELMRLKAADSLID